MLFVYIQWGKLRSLESFIDESDKKQSDHEQKPLEFIHFLIPILIQTTWLTIWTDPWTVDMFIIEQKTFCLGAEKNLESCFSNQSFYDVLSTTEFASSTKSEHFNLEIDCTPNNTNPASMLLPRRLLSPSPI